MPIKPHTTSSGLLLIISGPSGVGKTTIARRIESQLGGVFSVSMTTRPKTAADAEAKDYYFVDESRFTLAREGGELLEWARVFGHWYGTPRMPVARSLVAGKLMILEIDVEGARQVKANMPDAYAVFVLPPSEQDLLVRLRCRKRDDEQAIQRRFKEAKDEIARAKASGIYDSFLVNDDLESVIGQAVDQVNQRWAKRPGPGAAS